MSAETVSSKLTRHIPVLDGVRGLAILLVMLCHFWCATGTSPLDRWLGMVAGLGWVGVDLFFVLSGFLITGILLNAKGAPHYFRNFYMRRVLRIFPLYYLFLAIALLIVPHFLPPDKKADFGRIAGDEWYYAFYLSNFAIARAGTVRNVVLDVSWSLAIEEQFYLVWPAVIYYLNPRSVMRLAIGLAAGSLALRIVLHFCSNYGPLSIYVLTPCHIDSLAIGALLAVRAREPGGLHPLRRHACFAVLAGAVLTIAIPICEELFGNPSAMGIGFGPVFNTVGFTILSVFFGGVLVLVATAPHASRLERIFTSRFLCRLGTYSYGLYLIHLPVRIALGHWLFGPTSKTYFRFPVIFGSEVLGLALFYLMAGTAAVGVAFISYRLFEQPFLKLKRYFPT